MYDYLIVGAGLFGSVFAYEAGKKGKSCLVVEKRDHIGGNIYTEEVEGINVHKYGAHIFHTSDKRIWQYMQQFAEFNRYTNSPVANYKGEIYNLPFNMNTFNKLWGVVTPNEAKDKIQKQVEAYRTSNPKNLEEQALNLVGKDIYEKLIKGYTEKQWGRSCTELPAFIIRRLPVRMTFDNNYFNDSYQGIPIGGYNRLIGGLLEGCDVELNTDFFHDRNRWMTMADKVVFTGRIDEFYGYRFGKLEYRTMRFETELLDEPNHQGNAVVNYTSSDVPYTRIIEHKHFETFGNAVYNNPHTVISREYSTEWIDGMEPFYPVNDTRNQTIYEQYRTLAEQEQNIIFGGRLAEYRYYDMAPIIRQTLNLF